MNKIFALLVLTLSVFIVGQAQTKTRVIDTLTDGGGNPLSGKVTFILTQKSVTSPDGLIAAKATVSGVLTSSGHFDVTVYASHSLSPTSYYQVWHVDNNNNQELLGVYDIPASGTAIPLTGHKVTDTSLAAQYTFASVTDMQAATAAAATATTAQLYPSLVAGKHVKWDGVSFSNSIISESGSTATVTGNASVTGRVMASGGYSGILSADIPSVSSDLITGVVNDAHIASAGIWNAKQPALGFSPENSASKGQVNGYAGLDSSAKVPTSQLPTVWNNVTCIDCTSIGSGTGGGVVNTGDTVIGAASTGGSGVLALQVKGGTGLQLENDGSVTINRLNAPPDLALEFQSLPLYWKQEEYTGNPTIDVNNNPYEVAHSGVEQYTPSGVKVGSFIYVATKGATRIYLWRCDSNAINCVLQNSNNAVITPGSTYDSSAAVEPRLAYDSTANVIHMLYKCWNGTTYSTCHATASGSSPNTWTKDPANPILTSASVQSVLGTATLVDMAISSLVVNGGVYTFYGYAVEGTSGSPSSRSHLFRATGTTWNNPVVQNKIITCGPQRNCSVPEVFKHPQSKIWTMIFTEGSYLQTPSLRDYRNLVVMTSPDGATWARLPQNDVLLNPSMTAVGSLGWKDRQAFAASIVKKLSGEPELSNGRLMMLISGVRGADLHTNSGVVYLTPSIATTPLQLVQSAASSGFPKLWLKNSNNSLEDGGLDSDDTSGHVDMLVGSNFRFNKGGTTSVFDITQAAAGIYVGGGGYINLMSGAAGDSVETVLQISPDKRVNFVKPIKDVATIEGSAGGILNLKITTGTAGNSDVGILQFQSGATGISRIFGFTGSVATDAGGMLFQTRPSGGAYLSVLMMDEAGNMYFRNDAGTLKQVGYSANDSCGTGFRCIRIPN